MTLDWNLQHRNADAPKAALRLSLADRLVLDLAAHGITTYFGVPGGAIEPLFSALARQQRAGRVQLITTRSEAGAAFAADGYYRATGRIAVCTSTTGPGISNLTTGVLSAYADRIPMLIVTPQPPLSRQSRGAFQECDRDPHDFVGLLGTCTRYSTAVTHPAQLAFRLAQALRIAITPPTGPVHLSIPSDLLAGCVDGTDLDSQPSPLPQLALLDETAVSELVAEIHNAEAPVFYVGDDAGPDAPSLCRLANAMGGTVVSSPAGKRWLSHLEPSYFGVVGFAGHAKAHEAIRKADLVVTFGATFDEFSTNGWTVFAGHKLFAVDRHTAFAYRQPTARVIVGEIAEIVSRLLRTLPQEPSSQQHQDVSAPPSLVRSVCSGPVHPLDLMSWLSQKLANDVVVHVDGGSSLAWSTQALVRAKPDTYRVALGAGSMCWAIGAALGAAVAERKRVVCVTGDGAMLMSSLELTVAAERSLPITYLVVNNSSLGMVHHGQCLSGAEQIATTIPPVRFDLLARACGVQSIRVGCRAELDQVPSSWLADGHDGPLLIDVQIDPTAVPPIKRRVAALNSGMRSS